MQRAKFQPLRRIPTSGGEVRHGLKASEIDFAGFGEVYFSEVLPGMAKGWKRHSRMVMNLIVVSGEVRFIVGDGVHFDRFHLSPEVAELYGRLTVPPGLWMAFGGISRGLNLVCNLASLEHDPAEAEIMPLDAMPWNWDS